MKFEEALKAMREGKEVSLKNSYGTYFMRLHITSKGHKDFRIYYKSPDGKICQVPHFKTRYLTTYDWEVIEDEI